MTNRTLTVLETCVSNCSRRFHVLVTTKDFIQDLVKLIGPKNNPPIDLQERVLRLIERWADAFRNQPDLGGVVAVYNELKAKGVTFPPRDPNANVPITTPQRSVPRTVSPPAVRPAAPGRVPAPPQMAAEPLGPVHLEGEGYNKISQDLAVVQSSIEMFNEILNLLESKDEESDAKLASDMSVTCRQMKDRIVDLIERVSNEDLTVEFLRLNDELNNIFIRYDRIVKNRTKSSNPQQAESEMPVNASTADPVNLITNSGRAENELSLIDLNAEVSGDHTAVIKASASTSVSDPFDTRAIIVPTNSKLDPATSNQRQTKNELDPLADDLSRLNMVEVDKTKKVSGLPEEISSVREQDFAEIENWLSTDSGRDLTSISRGMPSLEPVSIPNTEFDNFIASRALAGGTSSSGTSKPEPDRKQEPAM